jgi:transcriptional regulator with XRE-family HTH domain
MVIPGAVCVKQSGENFLVRTSRMKPIEKMSHYIKAQGMTDAEFAAALGTSPSAISEMKRGKRGVTSSTARRAAKLMEVSIDWLMDESASWPPPPTAANGLEPGGGLTEAERKLVSYARDLCEDDPTLKEAFRRLQLRGYRKDD